MTLGLTQAETQGLQSAREIEAHIQALETELTDFALATEILE
jgi:hypothetical protein